jgi:hypothetical protein
MSLLHELPGDGSSLMSGRAGHEYLERLGHDVLLTIMLVVKHLDVKASSCGRADAVSEAPPHPAWSPDPIDFLVEICDPCGGLSAECRRFSR